jgi:acetyl-CoA C-acetyltransferase
LRTSFVSTGTVTAGNASSLNDGASAMLLLRRDVADKMGIKYEAVLDAYAEAGVDPQVMGYAPYYVVKRLLKKTGTDKAAIDRFELNEAFAAQSVAVTRALDLDTTKVNVNGGAIALGHPLGDSGARIVTTLIHELQNSNLKTGIAALCIGGGLGVGFQLHLVSND